MFQQIIDACTAERAKNDESKVFVLCILSHGEIGAVIGTDGQLVQIKDLETLFDGLRCKKLVGRPKLLLIQACQGGLFFRYTHHYIYLHLYAADS